MVQAAWGGTQDADLIALIVDGRAGLGPKMEPILDGLAKRKEPKWLILNKVDIAAKEKLLTLTTRIHERIGVAETYYVSAMTGDGLPELKAAMAAAMPEGPWHFPEDQVSDATDACWPPRSPASSSTTSSTRTALSERGWRPRQYKERADGSFEIHQQILVARRDATRHHPGQGRSAV